MKKLFTATMIMGLFLTIPAQQAFPAAKVPIGVSQSVDKKSVYVGDRIKYTIEVKATKGCEVQFPAFSDYRIGDFEIKDSGSKTSNRIFGGKIFRRWYSVAVYSTGKQAIPEVDIRYRTKDAKNWDVKKTKSITINVASVLPAGQQVLDIKDIKGPLTFRNVYSGILALAIALALVLAIGAIVYGRLKRYVPIKLPHETALEELESIRAQYLQGSGVKEFYVGVSDCVRHYIERAFKLKAPEMTTEEFLESLRESPVLSPDQKSLLKGFMSACDMVKFAKYTPSSIEAEAVYTTAKNFIHETSIALAPLAVPSTTPKGGGGS
jgi:hypothetical protein